MCWWHPFRWWNRKLKNAWGGSFTSILRQHCSQKELPPSTGYFILRARDSMCAPALTMSTRWNGEGKWWKLLFWEKRLELSPEPSRKKRGVQLDTGWPQLATQSWAKPLKGQKRLWGQVLLQLFRDLGVIQLCQDRSCSYFSIATPDRDQQILNFTWVFLHTTGVQSPSYQHPGTQSRTSKHEPWARNQLCCLAPSVKSHGAVHGSH